jgi:hypothetical protein
MVVAVVAGGRTGDGGPARETGRAAGWLVLTLALMSLLVLVVRTGAARLAGAVLVNLPLLTHVVATVMLSCAINVSISLLPSMTVFCIDTFGDNSIEISPHPINLIVASGSSKIASKSKDTRKSFKSSTPGSNMKAIVS